MIWQKKKGTESPPPVLFIVLPFSVPMVPFICFALCMIYSQFILTKIKIQKAQENFNQNDEENN